MIPGVDCVRALESPKVGHIGDRDDDRAVASTVVAHRARILRIDIAAYAAHLDFFERRLYGSGERRHDLIALLDKKERRAPRRARSEARQARKQTDQALDFGASCGSGHGDEWRPVCGATARQSTAVGRAAR